MGSDPEKQTGGPIDAEFEPNSDSMHERSERNGDGYAFKTWSDTLCKIYLGIAIKH